MSLTLEEMLDAAGKLNGGWTGSKDDYQNTIVRGMERTTLNVRKEAVGYTLEMTYKGCEIGKYTGPEIRALFEEAESYCKSVINPVELKRKMREENRQKWANGRFRGFIGGDKRDKSNLDFEEILAAAEKIRLIKGHNHSETYYQGYYGRNLFCMDINKKNGNEEDKYKVKLRVGMNISPIHHSFESRLTQEQNKAIFEHLEESYYRKEKEKAKKTRKKYLSIALWKMRDILPQTSKPDTLSEDEIMRIAGKLNGWNFAKEESEKRKVTLEQIYGTGRLGPNIPFLGIDNSLYIEAAKIDRKMKPKYKFIINFSGINIYTSKGEEAERLFNLAQGQLSEYWRSEEAEIEQQKAAAVDEYREVFSNSKLPLSRRLGR